MRAATTMKPLLAFLWKRRWCRALLWAAIVFGLACLHPFVRQAVFGPKIDGIPWCVWENRVRAQVHGEEPKPKPWLYQFLEKVGLLQTERGGLPLDSMAALPLYLQLADDGDANVRRFALDKLSNERRDDQPETLLVLQRHLKDSDRGCRWNAADGILRRTKDAELRQVVLPLLELNDPRILYRALHRANALARYVPETFEPLAKLCEWPVHEGAHQRTRLMALRAMPSFGKRAIPVFRKALKDTDWEIRRQAIINLAGLREDAAELIPELLEAQDNHDVVARVLPLIDPERFPAPAEAVK